MEARLFQRSRSRPLRCGSKVELANGGLRDHLDLCRICWDDGDDGNKLVEPCACSGSMRHVHERCLGQWQQELRVQKGIGASRRCDVCKAPWVKPFMPPATPKDWREALRSVVTHVPWGPVFEFWKFWILVAGSVHGMHAGVQGFRTGMRWAAGNYRTNIDGLVRWGPGIATAASTMPALKLPLAMLLGTFVTGIAAQAALMSLVCAYTGSMMGFATGVANTLVGTVQLGSCLLQKGTMMAGSLAGRAFRGTALAGRLAAPLVLGLLRTLTLARVFT